MARKVLAPAILVVAATAGAAGPAPGVVEPPDAPGPPFVAPDLPVGAPGERAGSLFVDARAMALGACIGVPGVDAWCPGAAHALVEARDPLCATAARDWEASLIEAVNDLAEERLGFRLEFTVGGTTPIPGLGLPADRSDGRFGSCQAAAPG